MPYPLGHKTLRIGRSTFLQFYLSNLQHVVQPMTQTKQHWTKIRNASTSMNWTEFQSECPIANITFALLFPGYWLFRILQLKRTSVTSVVVATFCEFKERGRHIIEYICWQDYLNAFAWLQNPVCWMTQRKLFLWRWKVVFTDDCNMFWWEATLGVIGDIHPTHKTVWPNG